MRIYLYTNNSEPIKVYKRLTNQTTIEGEFRDSVSILNPTIVIESQTIPQFNYCYIPDLNRYYYINNIDIYRKDVYILYCSVDVLMTYIDSIYNQYAYVTRNQYDYNSDIVDNYHVFEQEVTTQIVNGDTSGCLQLHKYSDITEENVVLNTMCSALKED